MLTRKKNDATIASLIMDPDSLMKLLEVMISQQREKLLRLAREISPHLTPEDIRNPQDFPDLVQDPVFNYEDGILTGYLSVESALNVDPIRIPLKKNGKT